MSMFRTAPLLVIAFVATAWLAACGGGSSGSGSSVGGDGPTPPVIPPPPPPPPPTNHAPTVSLAIANQRGIQLHPFDFDVTQGGRTFTDPEGDAITYTIRFSVNTIGGLRSEGTHIVGVPEKEGF